MIIYQQVFCGNRVGFATIDTDNRDTFWITYTDWDLNFKVGKPILFKNIPYSRNDFCGFDFGKVIYKYDRD